MDFWPRFENVIGDRFPKILISFLKENGYDNAFALKLLTSEAVDYLEKFGLENSEYSKCHNRLLPGHRATLLALPALVEEFQSTAIREPNIFHKNSVEVDDPNFSFILQQLIKTAKDNANKDVNHRRFPEELKYFSMLLYMMCGKISYEIISKNLPLPQASTTCKSHQLKKNFFQNMQFI